MTPNPDDGHQDTVIETRTFVLCGVELHCHLLGDGRRVIDAEDILSLLAWVPDFDLDGGDEDVELALDEVRDWTYGEAAEGPSASAEPGGEGDPAT